MTTIRLLLILFSVFQFCFANAQRKSKKRIKTDTVYVYEKVIVKDTVFIERAIKLSSSDAMFSQNHVFTPTIENRPPALNIKRQNNIKYGLYAGIGIAENTFFSNFSNKKQIGEQFGVWVEKKIWKNRISFQLFAGAQVWNSTFEMDATNKETPLSGFYFSNNNEPLLFQKFNNKNTDVNLGLKLSYEWKKLRLQIGPSYRWNSYKMQFLVPENGILSKLEDFKSKNYALGYELGLQYQIFNHLSVFAGFQSYKFKGLKFTSPNFDFEMYPNSTTFVNRNYFLGLSYSIPK